MDGETKPTLGFIGAGKVGSTLAILLFKRGYHVVAVHSRTTAHAQRLADYVNAPVSESPSDVVSRADLTFLTVPDDTVIQVANSIQFQPASSEKRAVVHTSGALNLSVLENLQTQGLEYGSMHPAFPFADVEFSINQLPGSTFALQASSIGLLEILTALVKHLDGHVIILDTNSKVLYHAAMVFASNYVVSLYDVAKRLLLSIGADEQSAASALNNLLKGTTENLFSVGTPDALTGPLLRRDIGTVQAHLHALETFDSDLAAAYKALARITLPLLEQQDVSTQDLAILINQDNDNPYATDNS